VTIDSDEGLKGDKSVHQNTGKGEPRETLFSRCEANQENPSSPLTTYPCIR
jgi:hypothetical protein